jgi:hypothetical protein
MAEAVKGVYQSLITLYRFCIIRKKIIINNNNGTTGRLTLQRLQDPRGCGETAEKATA